MSHWRSVRLPSRPQQLGQGEHGGQRRFEVVAGHALHVLAQEFGLFAVGDVDDGIAQDVGEMGGELRAFSLV
jgi:hypothetical protein